MKQYKIKVGSQYLAGIDDTQSYKLQNGTWIKGFHNCGNGIIDALKFVNTESEAHIICGVTNMKSYLDRIINLQEECLIESSSIEIIQL